jgi:hypothetical protein
MSVMIITLWHKGVRAAEMMVNSEGRLDYPFPPGRSFDRVTIEMHNPNSRVRFTSGGGVFLGDKKF